jgi:hypothetical protein
VLASVVLLAACGGGSPKIADAQLPKLVLQPADLPRVFSQFDVGRQVRLDRVPGPRFDTTRFGREDGWKARYNRPGSRSTRGPLVVESRVDLFRDAAGATNDLAAYREQFRREPDVGIGEDFSGLGDDAVTWTRVQPGPPAVRYVSVAWSDANVTASVSVNGFATKLKPADALALARAQERHIAAALGR